MTNKVWLYQTNKPIVGALAETLLNHLNQFSAQWKAHGKSLDAKFWFHNPYLLICEVDESLWGASGCSIDSKVRFLKELGEKFDIDFFVRMKTIVHLENGQFEQLDFGTVKNVAGNFTIFNPTVASSDQLSQLFTEVDAAPMKRLLV
jgi:hypothetical protein